MASGVYNFQNTARSRTACEQGATFRRRITLLDDDGAPINLSGYVVRMQVRNAKTNVQVIELTTENGRITVNATEGRMLLDVGASVTAALPVGIYLYDLELVASANSVMRLLEGKFQVTRNVTT